MTHMASAPHEMAMYLPDKAVTAVSCWRKYFSCMNDPILLFKRQLVAASHKSGQHINLLFC